ncbi:MAG: DNA/RNA helicase domain-containing protein, partial [Candidatus Parvarchaeota archaeon]
IKVRWLMDEKTQYPRYWMGLMDPLSYCASVYGAQGFESGYVGVIWGRDLVRRGSSWQVNRDRGVITDKVDGNYSLLALANKDLLKAERLLKNRYYILLTRGIRGTYVFFEDSETKEYVDRAASLSS